MRALQGHAHPVLSLAFSPDGQRLASGGADRSVRLWDVPSGQKLLTMPGVAGSVDAVAFSPDGGRLAATEADVVIWSRGGR